MPRVKLYRLNEEGLWDDKGTGQVTVEVSEPGSTALSIVMEDSFPEVVLRHQISARVAYQRQSADTIITWTEPDESADVALSFQQLPACALVWRAICEARGERGAGGGEAPADAVTSLPAQEDERRLGSGGKDQRRGLDLGDELPGSTLSPGCLPSLSPGCLPSLSPGCFPSLSPFRLSSPSGDVLLSDNRGGTAGASPRGLDLESEDIFPGADAEPAPGRAGDPSSSFLQACAARGSRASLFEDGGEEHRSDDARREEAAEEASTSSSSDSDPDSPPLAPLPSPRASLSDSPAFSLEPPYSGPRALGGIPSPGGLLRGETPRALSLPLPPPTRRSLPRIAEALCGAGVFQRDALACALLRPGYLAALAAAGRACRERGDRRGAAAAGRATRGALLLGDSQLLETMLGEERHFWEVLDALEFEEGLLGAEGDEAEPLQIAEEGRAHSNPQDSASFFRQRAQGGLGGLLGEEGGTGGGKTSEDGQDAQASPSSQNAPSPRHPCARASCSPPSDAALRSPGSPPASALLPPSLAGPRLPSLGGAGLPPAPCAPPPAAPARPLRRACERHARRLRRAAAQAPPEARAKMLAAWRVARVRDGPLAGCGDEGLQGTLSSLVLFNGVEALGALAEDAAFFPAFFRRLARAREVGDARAWRRLARFFYELLGLARHLQALPRAALLRRLAGLGLYDVTCTALGGEMEEGDGRRGKGGLDGASVRAPLAERAGDVDQAGTRVDVDQAGTRADVDQAGTRVCSSSLKPSSPAPRDGSPSLSASSSSSESECEALCAPPGPSPPSLRLKAVEALLADAASDPGPLRAHLASAAGAVLVRALLAALLGGAGGGLEEQAAELLRALLGPDAGGEGGSERDAFTDVFYGSHLGALVEALAAGGDAAREGDDERKGDERGRGGHGRADSARLPLSTPSRPPPDPHVPPPAPPPASAPPAAVLARIVDLLCFCVSHHSYRIKYFILRNAVLEKVLALLFRRERFLAAGAVRFLRTCLGMKDEFYNRYVIKHALLEPVADAFLRVAGRYNLLHSALLELFEHLWRENLKGLLAALVASPRWDELRRVPYASTFARLLAKHEQNAQWEDEAGGGTGAAQGVVGGALSLCAPPDASAAKRARQVAREEEDGYFSEAAQEPEEAPGAPEAGAAADDALADRPRRIVDYDDDDDDALHIRATSLFRPSAFQQGSGGGEKRLRLELGSWSAPENGGD